MVPDQEQPGPERAISPSLQSRSATREQHVAEQAGSMEIRFKPFHC